MRNPMPMTWDGGAPVRSLTERIREEVVARADEHSIEWTFRDGVHPSHGHALVSAAVVDALAGLDDDDLLALRIAVRWLDRPSPPRDLYTEIARLPGIYLRQPNVPIDLGKGAIWGCSRRYREELAFYARPRLEERLRAIAFDQETRERAAARCSR